MVSVCLDIAWVTICAVIETMRSRGGLVTAAAVRAESRSRTARFIPGKWRFVEDGFAKPRWIALIPWALPRQRLRAIGTLTARRLAPLYRPEALFSGTHSITAYGDIVHVASHTP